MEFVRIIYLNNTIGCITLNRFPLLNVVLKHVSLKFTPFCMFVVRVKWLCSDAAMPGDGRTEVAHARGEGYVDYVRGTAIFF